MLGPSLAVLDSSGPRCPRAPHRSPAVTVGAGSEGTAPLLSVKCHLRAEGPRCCLPGSGHVCRDAAGPAEVFRGTAPKARGRCPPASAPCGLALGAQVLCAAVTSGRCERRPLLPSAGSCGLCFPGSPSPSPPPSPTQTTPKC